MLMPRLPVHTRLARTVFASVLAVAMAAVALRPSPSCAQDKFELKDDDWQPQTQVDPASPEGKLRTIRQYLAGEDYKFAYRLANDWIDTYPNHPNLVEAYLLRGDTLAAQREYYKALFDYEMVARLYPASEHFQTALEREYEIARLFSNGIKRKFAGMRILPADGEAEELYIRIQERAPGSELGSKASLTLADHYYARSDMTRAAEAYELFLENYPRSPHREQAMLRMIQASLATFKGPKFDSTGLIEASQRLKSFQDEFPAAAERIGADALLVRIESSKALKILYSAQWYERQGKRVPSIYMYQRVVRDYPQTEAAQQAIAKLKSLGAPVQRVEGPSGPRPGALPDPDADDAGPAAPSADTTPPPPVPTGDRSPEQPK